MEPMLSTAARAPADLVKDSNTTAFRADVLDASMTLPVIVDFWAPWCGPCKQLGPALEKAVMGARGKVRLVKINVDENQQLAAQMRVQSIPAVYAFFQGRPVDYFMGALPESQIKTWVERLVELAAGQGGGESPIDEALAEAKTLLDEGDFQTAGGIYSQILQHEPELPAALAGLARCLLGLGETEEAKAVIDRAPPAAAKHADIVSVRSMIELAAEAAGAAGQIPELMDRLARSPDNHAIRFDLAMALYAAGKREAAVGELLEIIRRDREWNEQAARKQLIKLFEAFGPTDPLTLSSRRRLSSLLFS